MNESKKQKTGEPLICLNCNLVYESGTVCTKCGFALLPQHRPEDKEEPGPVPAPEAKTASPEAGLSRDQPMRKPVQKLICPNCKILYERSNSCIRCGSPLVKEDAYAPVEKAPEKVEPQLPHTPEFKTEVPPPLSTREVKREVPKKVSRPEVRSDRPPIQTPEERRLDRLPSDMATKKGLPRKGLQKYLRLSFEIGSLLVMVGAGGYLVWSIYSHYMMKRPEQSAPVSKEATILPSGAPLPTIPTTQVPEPREAKDNETGQSSSASKEVTVAVPATSKIPSGEAQEIENIGNLLEKIRQANLQKDIALFMSCYSTAFKGREGKKKETLETWDNFNYLNLSYDLKKVEILANTAHAKIEWLVRFSPKAGGQPQESKTILDVNFQKEDSGWRIIEVKN